MSSFKNLFILQRSLTYTQLKRPKHGTSSRFLTYVYVRVYDLQRAVFIHGFL